MAFPLTVNLAYGMEKVESASQKHKLGTRGVLPDGRVFWYAKNSSAAISTAGMIVDGSALVAAHDMDVPPTAAQAVGTTEVSLEVPTTDLTKNQYADGYLVFNDEAGEGEIYRIKSHPAHDASEDATVLITLDEPDGLRTAITTDTEAQLVYNPYTDVKLIDGDGTQTTGPLGVTTIPVTASYYCWIQSSGLSSVAVSGTTALTLGDSIEVSQVSGQSGTATLCDSSGATDLMPIGTAMGVASVSGDKGLVMLSIRS
ncbi:MAG: hypothetical protein Unbinned1068contig1000_30 [Prokaryotic dsDNA virus sp.]|nr:MAG: hypothetical protein Unbinned1068contig1000_30 [Prokaryotic dsDNA virus sp.]|tara:strand:- start:224 stop:994 length:771 start_codon:yes stop_codon:yes gene_type:complete